MSQRAEREIQEVFLLRSRDIHPTSLCSIFRHFCHVFIPRSLSSLSSFFSERHWQKKKIQILMQFEIQGWSVLFSKVAVFPSIRLLNMLILLVDAGAYPTDFSLIFNDVELNVTVSRQNFTSVRRGHLFTGNTRIILFKIKDNSRTGNDPECLWIKNVAGFRGDQQTCCQSESLSFFVFQILLIDSSESGSFSLRIKIIFRSAVDCQKTCRSRKTSWIQKLRDHMDPAFRIEGKLPDDSVGQISVIRKHVQKDKLVLTDI